MTPERLAEIRKNHGPGGYASHGANLELLAYVDLLTGALKQCVYAIEMDRADPAKKDAESAALALAAMAGTWGVARIVESVEPFPLPPENDHSLAALINEQ